MAPYPTDNRGVIMVVLAVGVIVLFFAFSGLAVEVGRAYVVKGELQKAADAAALAGAGNLYLLNATAPPRLSTINAREAATGFLGKNVVENKAVVDGHVESGYWQLDASTDTLKPEGTVPGRCSVSGITCTYNSDCAATDLCIQQYAPAVRVTLNTSGTENGGPVTTFFSRVLGWNQFEVSGNATAVSGFAGMIPQGLSYPFVITSCLVNAYFAQQPLPDPPAEINSTSIYHLKDGTSVSPGQWTNLLPVAGPSAEKLKEEYIENLIDPAEGAPPPATKVGDPIFIDPGTKASVFHKTQQLIDAGRGLVYLPVVDCTITPFATMPIRGYAAFQLTSTSNSSITGHFVGMQTSLPGSGPGGAMTNVVSAPKLVK